MDQQYQDAFPAPSKFLQTCEVLTSDVKVESFAIVLFGGTGDLSKRMLLPSLYNLKKDGRLPEDFVIIAFGLPKMSDEQFRNFARKSLETFSRESFKTNIWEEFSPHLLHISSDFNSDEGYRNLYNRIGETCRSTPEHKKEIVFFLAVPPFAAPVIVTKIGEHKFCGEGFVPKIITEKPFGRDRASASALNRTVLGVFSENQIYRVDHYLGKETNG